MNPTHIEISTNDGKIWIWPERDGVIRFSALDITDGDVVAAELFLNQDMIKQLIDALQTRLIKETK